MSRSRANDPVELVVRRVWPGAQQRHPLRYRLAVWIDQLPLHCGIKVLPMPHACQVLDVTAATIIEELRILDNNRVVRVELVRIGQGDWCEIVAVISDRLSLPITDPALVIRARDKYMCAPPEPRDVYAHAVRATA